jgi:hypothetical protein
LNLREYSLCGQLDLAAGQAALRPREAAVAVVTDSKVLAFWPAPGMGPVY